MSGKHSHQNHFHGSTGGARRVKGGVANVTEDMTIGAHACWCQGDICWRDEDGHLTWPGKDKGEPHPRFAVRNDDTDEDEMTTMTKPEISNRELRGWDHEIANIVRALVNEHGVRFKITSRNRIMLFPFDRTGEPLTITQARNPGNTVKFLKGFAAHEGIDLDDKADHFAATCTRRTKGTCNCADLNALRQQVEPTPPPVPVPAQITFTSKEPITPVYEIPMEEATMPDTETVWTRHKNREDIPTNYETDGNGTYRCIPCRENDVIWTTTDPTAFGGHTRMSHRDRTGLYSEEARARAQDSKRFNRLVEHAGPHVEALMHLLGMEVDSAEVERLRSENAALRRRAEDAEAAIALLRETLGALK
jgi:hypothetical protein